MALFEHLEKLRHFSRLTNYRSLREGSIAMGISQAGLSKSISALEDVLGTQLFLRTQNGLILTKEGHEVLLTSERILRESSDLEGKLRLLHSAPAPTVFRVGMYDSIAVYFFSELDSYIKKLYPGLAVRLIVDTSAALTNLVLKDQLDIAIGVNLNRNQILRTEFFKLFDDHYSFYVSSRHDVNERNSSFLINLKAEDYNGKSIERYLSSGLKKNGFHQVFNFETLKTLTVQGLGIGILPTQVAKPLIKTGMLESLQIPRTKQFFGSHNIGCLASRGFLKDHLEFAKDIYRLGNRWSKN